MPFLCYPCLLSIRYKLAACVIKDQILLTCQRRHGHVCYHLQAIYSAHKTNNLLLPRWPGPSLSLSITIMTLHTRPSHFSACNIEKLGMGLGTRLHVTCNLLIINFILIKADLPNGTSLPKIWWFNPGIYTWSTPAVYSSHPYLLYTLQCAPHLWVTYRNVQAQQPHPHFT